MKNNNITFGLLLFLVSCSSSNLKKAGSEEVLSRIDNLDDRPSWFKESQDVEETGEKIVFWGSSTLKRGERIEVGYKISELDAKAKIANYVSEKINTITQSADEVSDEDRSTFRSIITQRAKVRLSETKSGKRYWEKVLVFNDHGERQVEYRVFQSIQINKSDLNKLVREALNAGKNRLSEDFTKKVEAEWNEVQEG